MTWEEIFHENELVSKIANRGKFAAVSCKKKFEETDSTNNKDEIAMKRLVFLMNINYIRP